MTDHEAIRDDIAFLRSLAEDGRNGPMSGGSILFAGGLIFGAASLAAWFALARNLVTGNLFFPVVWFGAAGLFTLVMSALKRRMGPRGGASRAAGVAWSGAGWAVLVIVISLMIASWRAGDWLLMGPLPAVILTVYGSAWYVGAVLTRVRWVYAVAFGSFAMALVAAWFAAQPATLFLVFAASLLALLALPGFLLMRQTRRAG